MAETFFAITFKDGTTVYGRTATEVLENLTGGFNPPTVRELRLAFLRRAGCYAPEPITNSVVSSGFGYSNLSDLEFLEICSEPPIDLWKLHKNVERPFPVSRTNGESWAVTAQLPKRPAIAR